MKSELVAFGKKSLFVEDSGAGPAVVFVHGLGGATTFFDPLVPALEKELRLLRFDFEGHGRSPLTGPFSVASLAEDTAKVIESLPEKRAHVVAHSMGTLVAQELAARFPKHVESLVLLGPVRAQAEAAKAATRARAATVRERGMSAVAETIAQNATSPAARAANPLVLALVRELLLGQDAEGYALACEALAAAENPDLSKIEARTLLLAGDEDKLSTAALLEELRAGLAHAEVATTSDCGHWTAIEAPAFVARKTLEFIRRTS